MLGVLRAQCPALLWATVFLDLPLNLTRLTEKDLRARVLHHIRERV